MKCYLVLICCLGIINCVFSQKSFIINGELKGIEDGTHISLMKEEGSVGSEVVKDSVVNGHFHIEYTPKDGEGIERYSIMSFDKGFPSMSLKLWAKPGQVIGIEGDNKWVYTWKVKSDIPEQKEWSYFTMSNKALWDKYQQLSAIRHDMIEKIYSDTIKPDEKKAARATVDSVDSISNKYQYEIHKHDLALLQNGKMTPV